jgi:hypothetical protein
MMLRLEQMRRASAERPVPLSAWGADFWHQMIGGDSFDSFLRSAQAASTQATYASQQHQFQQFCQLLGMPNPRACFQADVLAAWVMGRSVHHYKLSTIELGVYAVCHLARQHGIQLSTSFQPLKSALQAAGRARGSGPTRKQPMLLGLLRRVCAVDLSCWRSLRDAAFYVVSWHGMLRGAEAAALRWEHVSVEAGRGLVLLVESSKTDQAAQGQFVFLHAHEDPSICPVRCLQRLAAATPSRLSGPIFTIHQHTSQQLQKSTMLTRLHRRLQQLGEPSSLFGLHSLRSGGATAAAHNEVPERLIKIQGRWVSDTVRIYTCAVPADRWAAAAALGVT